MRKYRKIDIAILSLLCLLLVLVVIIGVCLYNGVNQENESSKIANQGIGNILTGTVELTISKDMLALFGDGFDYNLSQEQKDNGFTDIKKNEDGSATYTIKKKDYEKFIDEYKTQTKNTLNEIINGNNFTSIQKIQYTENFDKITIVAEKEKFENSFDSMCVMSCGLTSCMYQMFDVNSDGKCIVEVKDVATGEVFRTETYPQ